MKKLEFNNTDKKSKISSSILTLVIGLILLLVPGDILKLAIRIVAVAIIVVSGIGIYNNVKENKNVELAYNILIALLGIILFSTPTVIAGIIPFIIGIWVVIKSAFKISLVKDLNNKAPLIINIAILIIGILIVFHPFGSATLVLRLIGGFMVAYSIFDFIDFNKDKPKKVKVIK